MGVPASFSGCDASTKGAWRLFVVSLLVMVMAGCQTKPTVAVDNPARKLELAEKIDDPIKITESTVVIDARTAFDYSMAHVPRSINLLWSSFTEPEPASARGVLQKDQFAITRYLARIGISPETPVLVLGRGLQGGGEEGRIAWMLAYLGVKRVQFGDINSFRTNLTNAVSSGPQPAPVWKPEPIESLNATRAEVLHVINQRGTQQPTAFVKGAAPVLYKIIDVRSEKEYLGREGFGRVRKVPNMDAINIPWTEFFTKTFRPDKSVRERLQAVGILPEHRILVVGTDGVASGAVAMALLAMGYTQAANYSGGLVELLQLRDAGN